ncbi:MAG: tetratricopeptide repeat protein [Anaerolineae bacterium]
MVDSTGQSLGKYQVVERLAATSLADVYKAHDPGLGCDVALKVFHAPLAGDTTFLERLRQEVRLAASLRHPHIARVYGYDVATLEGQPLPYVVTEFAEGSTLKERLASYRASGQMMPLPEVLSLFQALGSALDYAHRHQVIHGGVKPANILFTAGGEPLLTDFGIARTVTSRLQALPSDVTGTPAYLAPEQARGDLVDGRADVYSLGVVLYELCTNTLPFIADTPTGVIMRHLTEPPPPPSRANPTLSAAMEQVILKALNKTPADRFQTAGEMVATWEKAAAGWVPPVSTVAEQKPIPPGPTPPPKAPPQPPLVAPVVGLVEEEEEERVAVPGPAVESEPQKKEGIRNFLVQILAVFTAALALLEKFLKAVDILRNPLIGLIVVGVAVTAMVVSAGYVLAHSQLYRGWHRRLAIAGLILTSLAAVGWGGWTIYDIKRPPKGLTVLIADFERDPEARSVNYAHYIESGLLEVLDELEVEGVYVERAYEVYTQKDARSRAAARKAAVVIYGRYDDARVEPRIELVRAPQQYMPLLKQASVGLVDLDQWEVRVDRSLKEMNYIAAAAIGLAYYVDGQNDQALSFFDLALKSAPEEALLTNKEVVYFYKGTTHFYLNQFPQALAALQEAVRLNPDLYAAHHNLAIAYSVNCDLTSALRETDEALRLKPDSGDAYYFRGALLMLQSRWDEAATALLKAVELSPDNAAAHASLGQTYERLGRADKAAAEYQKAMSLTGETLKAKPDDPLSIVAHADTLWIQGKWEEAAAEYQQAIQQAETLRLRPERLASLHRSLGRAYLDLERWTEAVDAYTRAIALSPGLSMDYVSLGMAYGHLGQSDQAVAAYQQAIALMPCEANTHDLLGDLYRQLGRAEEALAEYREAVKYAPDDFTAWQSIGQILEERGEADEAKAAYEKAVAAAQAYLEHNPRDAAATSLLGLMHLLLGNTQEAISALQKAVALQPDADNHHALGNAYYEDQEYDKALAEYQAALAADPTRVASVVALGDTYEKLGQTDEAIAAYREALALEENADVHAYIGILLARQGRADEAEAEYKASLQLEDNLLSHVGLGELYEKAGKTEQAIAEYEAALNLSDNASTLANLHITLARLYQTLGRVEEATGEYQAALALLPEDPHLDGTRATLALALLDQCRPDEALATLQPALERGKAQLPVEVLRAQATVYEAQGKEAEASEVYATMLRENPDRPEVHYFAAWFAYRQDRLSQAIEEMHEVLKLVPVFYQGWTELGYFYSLEGDPIAASYHSTALESQPWNVYALLGLGEIALQQGEPELALTRFQEALQQHPEYAKAVPTAAQTALFSIHLDLALAYERLGRTSDAAQELTTVRQLAEAMAAANPTSAKDRFRLAVAHWVSGETQAAEAAFAQAAQCDASLAAERARVQKRIALLRAKP